MSGFQFWVSAQKAKEFGCTHHARIFGVIPGFCTVDECPLWVSRSDLLNPVEDAIGFMWGLIQSTRDEEPFFAFRVGKPIDG